MRRGVLFGAALVGVAPTIGCKAEPDPAGDAGGGGSTGGALNGGSPTGGSTGGALNGGSPTGGGSAYPAAPTPFGCPPEPDAGPDTDPPLSGPCCQAIECYEPVDQGACVMPSESTADGGNRADEVAGLLGHEGLGSGECLCGVEGPYDPASAHAFTEEPGRCCYAVSINGCTGRPLVVDAVARIAPLVSRADWT